MNRGTFTPPMKRSKRGQSTVVVRDERNAFLVVVILYTVRSKFTGIALINASTTRLLPRRCGLAFSHPLLSVRFFVPHQFVLPPIRQDGN